MTISPAKGKQAIGAERIFDGERFHQGAALLIEDGRVVGIAARAEIGNLAVRDLGIGSILAPGFIDIQVNGGGGVLFNDDTTPEGMAAIARAHRRFGTTACLPTVITESRAKVAAAIAAAAKAIELPGVIGIHIEGPFINPARKGVHREDKIARAADSDADLLAGAGRAGCALVTLAPECVPEGFIKHLVKAGLRVSAGHSEATAAQIDRAANDGLTGVTHLFNAMSQMQPRAPGVVGAALSDARLFAGIIVDGLHVDPISVKAAVAAKGADRMILVTDAMPSVGSDKGFDLQGRHISLTGGKLVTEDGTLAGAHLDMASAVRNAVRLCGVSLEDALRMASATAAHFLGIENERGFLKPGARADLVALDSNLQARATWIGGLFEA